MFHPATEERGCIMAKGPGGGGGGGGTQDRNTYGTAGNDVLGTHDRGTTFGFAGNDTITGTAAADSVHGGDGNDIITTLGGNDLVHGGLGDDRMDGGAGIDWLNYGDDYGITPTGLPAGLGAVSGVTVNLNLTTAQNTNGAGLDTIIGFENVGGTQYNDAITGLAAQSSTIFARAGNDRITGGSAADSLWGETGDDTIDGGGGNDQIVTGAGNDILRGGAGDDFIEADFRDPNNSTPGNDVIDGGLGIDWLVYEGAATGVRVDLNILTAQNTGGGGIDTISNIETVSGSRFADVLTGNAGANTFYSNGGADVLNGMGGDDYLVGDFSLGTLNGGDGNDRILAGAFLNGGNGNDILYSELGKETMTGGSGADTFMFDRTTAGLDAWSTPDAIDVITDYSRLQGDKIDLHNYALGTTNVIGYADYTTFVGLSQIKFVNHGTYQTIEADVTGDRVSDFAIQITGAAPLIASDFILA